MCRRSLDCKIRSLSNTRDLTMKIQLLMNGCKLVKDSQKTFCSTSHFSPMEANFPCYQADISIDHPILLNITITILNSRATISTQDLASNKSFREDPVS
jgi:hypothetical protein